MLEIYPITEENREREYSKYLKAKTERFSQKQVEDLRELKKNILMKSMKYGTVGRSAKRNSMRLTDEQVLTISSMLPDVVIHNAYDYKMRKFTAAIFVADISGFTELSKKFQNFENGASKLSIVLNFYLGSMVQEILSHGGDVFKYAGDAFIAMFRANNELGLQDAIHRAINASLIIQKNCTNYLTEVGGVLLNVKLAISGGEVHFSLIGNEVSSHYVLVGGPIWQVKALQDITEPGEILVAPKAWFYTVESSYAYQYVQKYRCYKVTGFKDDVKFAQRQHEANLAFHEMERMMEIDSRSSFNASFEPAYDLEASNVIFKTESYTLRKSTAIVMQNRSKQFLCRFIVTPVLNTIDLNEPIDFLTEMRHVVIVFANFLVTKTSSAELIKIVDKIYNKLSRIVISHDGIVNKVSLFDKDMMFLVIFGLRGFKHELDSRIGLRCASELEVTFKSWTDIASVSIGVTSGMSYCGVVGHTLRREYSVISVTVNLAARLMMAYPNMVSCDQETMLLSKLYLKHFTLLPKKRLKGLKDDIYAYQFKEKFDPIIMETPRKYNFPILGRSEVLTFAQNLLKCAVVNIYREEKQMIEVCPKISCLLIKGDSQQGKTRVLDEIFSNCYENQLCCLRLSLNIKHSKVPYKVIAKIMEKALNFNEDSEAGVKEAIIRKKLEGFNLDEYLSIFNPMFDIKFDVSEAVEMMNEDNLCKVRKKMLKILCTQAFGEFLVVLINDVEYLDNLSLELAESLFACDAIFLFLVMGSQKKLTSEQKKIFHSSQIVQYRLESIDMMYQNQLACQFLDVDALSLNLEQCLNRNSKGNPGWIETFTVSLLQSKKLVIKRMSVLKAFRNGMTLNNLPNSLGKIIDAEDFLSIEHEYQLFNQCFEDSLFVNQAKTKESLVKVAMLQSIPLQNEFLMNSRTDSELMTYDSLSSYEQLVCKCASVLGVEFTRYMLSNVMSSSTDRMIGRTVMKLFELQIFVCASAIGENHNQKLSGFITCNCKDIKIFDACRDLPRYASCALVRFNSFSFRTVVYNLLTDKQRLDYHRRALLYLHMETKKCDSCGGGFFTSLMILNFDFKFHDGFIDHDDNSFELMVKYFESINLNIIRKSQRSIIKKLLGIKDDQVTFRPIIMNYLNYDFRSCKCSLILYSMYNEILRHYRGAEMDLRIIDSKIELARMCIKMQNIPRASSLLHKALVRLETTASDSGYTEYLRARAYTLQGVCFTCMMQKHNALENYYKACKILQVKFPKSYDLMAKLKFKQIVTNIKISIKNIVIKKCSKLDSLATSQLTKTLNFMFEEFFEMKLYELAKLAAFWSLRKSLKFNRNFINISRSFSKVFKIIVFTGSVNEFYWLVEAAPLQIARSLFLDDLDLHALTELIKMYIGIMNCLIAKKEIRLAISIGEASKRLCSRIQQSSLQTEIVPTLFILLLNQKRIQDAFVLIQRFLYTMKFTNDKNGLIWYHALCLDFLLDTSLTIIPYDACDQFYFNEKLSFWKEGCPEALSRFFANLLLWNIRHGIHEMANVWMEKLKGAFSTGVESSFNSTFTGLRVMEALTIQLSNSITDRNLTLFEHYDKEINLISKVMKSALKCSNCFIERYELHKIHFELVKKFDERHLSRLDKLMDMAIENQNHCAYDIIKHSKRAWKNELRSELHYFWINYSTQQNQINFNTFSYSNDRIFPFSLVIPKSGNF